MSTKIKVIGYDELHADTKAVRWEDARTSGWLTTSTCFAWKGGEAVGVVTGHHPNVRCYTIIRLGKKVSVVEGSLRDAMRAFGLDEKKYTVV